MKMKSRRRFERDRAKRDTRDRVRDAGETPATPEREDDSANADAPSDDLDPSVARTLLGYDA